MGLGIPPLQIKITLESNPLKTIVFVGRLGASPGADHRQGPGAHPREDGHGPDGGPGAGWGAADRGFAHRGCRVT